MTSWSHTSISFSTPAGVGKNLVVRVTTGAGQQDANTAVVFSYDSPVLTSLTPLSAFTAGGTTLTIAGTSLSTAGTVSVGGQPCTGPTFTHTQVTCTLPAGQGRSRAVFVTVAGVQSNSLLFNYADPTITGLNPATGTTAGGVDLTLTGTSFGTSSAAVTVGGNACAPIVSQSHTQVVCTLPAGHSTNNEVLLTVDALPSNTVFFSYAAPTVASISAAVPMLTAGNFALTVTGANYGAAGAAVVSVGGVNCPVASQTQTEIVCTMPPGEGANQLVQVGVGNQFSASLVYFSYAAPAITARNPASDLTVGGSAFTVTGTSFGLTGFVTVGGSACSPISRSHTQVA